ncbi:replicative DNA helicase [Leptospira ilyithenensis]|uniref:Replicative DNA helicase n=1 Tax=Leptospira ilyithenensis TaxID=2484901 RepID=A0A4R9LRW9_9LEPT|nr:replicative DNA helicase [Leptospira ilyithenensis]TGN10014.1 replicative DNA helicase [Leptospira ilyithenensis]
MNSNPLQEIESEKNLIGYLLMRGVAGQEDMGLAPDDFYFESHRRIFDAIVDLIQEGVSLDIVTVTNHMREKHLFKDEMRDLEYITSLYKDTVPSQTLDYYIKRVKRVSDRRKYVESLTTAIDKVKSEPGENDTVFSFIEQSLMDISRQERSKGLRRVRDDANTLIDYIKTVVANSQSGGGISGLKTHYEGFDQKTTGLKTHELMILAARPGNGKTTFALNIAANVALKERKTVAIFSLEMSRLELLLKLLSAEARIDSYSIKSGTLTQAQMSQLKDAVATITTSSIYIDDSGYLTIQEFSARVRQLRTTEDIGLIIVDYLQLMSDPRAAQGGRQQEVANISRGLKQMAREVGCPVIALSQMNRSIESRSKDQRPQLSDLRESGAIEQDADIVCFIYREEMVKPPEELEPSKKGMAEIIIAKNRAGATGDFPLMFNPKISRFDNVPI